MNRNLYTLLAAQFLTAFADNAILFAAIAMALYGPERGAWYVPALQASFLVAFVVLAAWVGPYADRRPKATVLTTANGIKAVGGVMMLGGFEPLLAYAVVGIGAAVYGPAKYGILPELVPHDALVKANGWIEGATILAILGGGLAGAAMADQSIDWALKVVVLLYLASALLALFIARTPPQLTEPVRALPHFARTVRRLLASPRARFATLGVSLFWAAAAVLRVVLVAWAPLVLAFTKTADIAELTLYSAIGIAVGAVLAPRLIPLEHLRRARLAAYLMGASILLLSLVDSLWPARAVLLTVGIMGGLFVVPINAALQEIGHRSVGSGGAVAVQHFFENLAMLAGTGLYSYAAAQGAPPVAAFVVLGVLVVAATFVVARRLPEGEAPVVVGVAETEREG